MRLTPILLSILAAMLILSCSRDEEETRFETHISGTITVDEEIDSSGDNSGIELLVSFQDTSGEVRDTVFYAVTDTSGFFSGTVTFTERDIYPVVVSRNRNMFGIINMVFADGDSITFNAQLPNVSGTSEISSRENDAFNTFERVDRNFNRVAQYINAGLVPADSVEIELAKWVDIYWELFENNPDTFGGVMGGNASIALASGWNDSLMLNRSEQLLEKENALRTTTRATLLSYHAENDGLQGALNYLDRLERLASLDNDRMNIQMDRIELLYDSSKTREANEQLDRFRQSFSGNRHAMDWAENISYDLEFLTPGSEFPEFAFETIFGDSVSNESLSGRPFLIEVTRFDNPLYQQQYDRSVAIYQIYNSFGLEIVTIPISTSDVSLQAFFEERGVLWEVVQPGSFDADNLLERLNVSRVPTRFLVNEEGRIIRRYIGNEYDEVVRGLQQIATQNEQTP